MNLTQFVGVAGFGIAGLLCLSLRQSLWIAIGSLNLLYCLECTMGWRHRLHDTATTAMGMQYAERAPLQITLLTGAFILGVMALAIVFFLARDPLVRIALIGTGIGGGLFLVEIISLHAVDRVLYQPMGPILLIGWLWLGLSLGTGVAAVLWRSRGTAS